MYYVGIDLGGTNIAVGLVNEEGKIIHKDSVPTGKERPYSEIIKDMAMLTQKVINDSEIDIKAVKSIGVGSPGIPNNKDGVLVYNNNLNFKDVHIREEMQKYINLPVYLDNDANCAALAESVAGAAKDVDNSVTVNSGTGVGSGIVINKKIYSGFNYAAAEMGHMAIVVGGELCTCGRRGCWEAYASATALIQQTQEAAAKNPDSLINKLSGARPDKLVFDAARQNDEVASKVVHQYIKYIAEGLINVINMFQPEAIVIGGGICREGEYLLKPLRDMIKEGVYGKGLVPSSEIRVAQMGNDAGIIGAAMLGKE